MKREERIKLAVQILDSKEAKEAFERCAFLFPETSIFWDIDLKWVQLVGDHVMIEFTSI